MRPSPARSAAELFALPSLPNGSSAPSAILIDGRRLVDSIVDGEKRMAALEEAFKDLTFLVRDHLWSHEQEKKEPLTKDDLP